MIKHTINLASIVQPSAFAVADRYLTIQVDYTNINGDFEIIPKQSLDSVNYDAIFDLFNKPVTFRIIKHGPGNTCSGTKTFNIDASLYTVSVKLVVSPIAGKFAADEGTVVIRSLISDSATTTAEPTTTAAPTTTTAPTTTS